MKLPITQNEKVLKQVADSWPMSRDTIMKRYKVGRETAREIRKTVVAKYGLEANTRALATKLEWDKFFPLLDALHQSDGGKFLTIAEAREQTKASHRCIKEWQRARGVDLDGVNTRAAERRERVFAKLDKMHEEQATKPRTAYEMKRLAECGINTFERWLASRGITHSYTVGRKAALNSNWAKKCAKIRSESASAKKAAKPQHYAPGRWFRSKRSGEIVPALFVVSGNEVKFFGATT